ncbi:competence protein CoiA family protein [Listeria grandensis]|uniref:competence protein CoiA family protein n=1 Tax=Listeria grandensis TaxID=1494963 RepID=UPI00164D18E4|nr:competence protein CoiA family protein [Listeria grandensis]MBC6316671.1 competence protein CoiA [Listeria grandensis]
MFTAKDQFGHDVVVTRGNVAFLKKQRNQYSCGCCAERLILKAGEINMPHFAHLASSKCRFASEGESDRHLGGKKYFLEWLILQDRQADVEVYLRDIKRQADILVDGRTVIEYQCSTVPVKELQQRTEDYLMVGLCVHWILGQDIRMVKGRYYLTAFQQAFIKCDPKLGYYLVQYLPENNRWTLLYQITMDTANRFYARAMTFDGRVRLDVIKKGVQRIKYATFFVKRELAFERQKQCYFYARFKKQSPFLRDVYEQGYYLQNLPMEVGVVLPTQFRVKTPALEWQFYIWQSFLRMLDIGDSFQLERVLVLFDKHVVWMPLIWNEDRRTLCMEYMHFLCKQGVLGAVGMEKYTILRQMKEVANEEVRFLDI